MSRYINTNTRANTRARHEFYTRAMQGTAMGVATAWVATAYSAHEYYFITAMPYTGAVGVFVADLDTVDSIAAAWAAGVSVDDAVMDNAHCVMSVARNVSRETFKASITGAIAGAFYAYRDGARCMGGRDDITYYDTAIDYMYDRVRQ